MTLRCKFLTMDITGMVGTGRDEKLRLIGGGGGGRAAIPQSSDPISWHRMQSGVAKVYCSSAPVCPEYCAEKLLNYICKGHVNY